MISSRLASILIGIAFLATGCGTHPAPKVDRLELMGGGGMGAAKLTIHLQSDGKGKFEIFDISKIPAETKGSFTNSPERFSKLVAELEPARRDSRPAADTSFLNEGCKAREQRTDSGGFYVRWTGPGLDQHVAYDFGCDYKRYEKRNDRLDAILSGLPIPRSQDAG